MKGTDFFILKHEQNNIKVVIVLVTGQHGSVFTCWYPVKSKFIEEFHFLIE